MVNKKSRVPLQVSPEFRKKLKDLKMKVYAGGIEKSLRELTEELSKSPIFETIEKKILSGEGVDLRLKFDGRKK